MASRSRTWPPWHALGRLLAPFWDAFPIKNRLKIDVKLDMFFDMFFDRFLIDFGMLFGSKFNQFWITFSKQRFHENEHPYNEKPSFSRFRGSGNRSNIDLKTVSKTTSIFGSIFDGFWTDFGSFPAPKIDQHRHQFRDRFLDGFKMAPFRLIIQSSSPKASKDT